MSTVICIGECMVELASAGGELMRSRFAGDAYNTAVYLKRARPGVDVAFLTVTGSDPLSLAMRKTWRAEGVDDALAFTDPARRPALYMIETDASGDRHFHYWRSESAARGWFKALDAAGGAKALDGADLIYVSGISLAILPDDDRAPAIALLRSLKGRIRIAFDPNLRPVLWPSIDAARDTVEQMASFADILLPSRQDIWTLYGVAKSRRQMALMTALGPGEIALTCEGDDALVHDGETTALAPPRARVIDTSGAGDSFNGVYLAARLTGSSPVEAAREGLALAARVVEHSGALLPKS